MQDLWADLTGDALPTKERGQRRGRRQRRLTEQAVLTDLRAWLLQEYLLPYATSLGLTRIFQRCCWIDGLGSPNHATKPAPAFMAGNGSKTHRKTSQADLATLPPAFGPIATIAQQLTQLERPMTLQSFVLDSPSKPRQKAPTREASTQPSEPEIEARITIPADSGVLTASWAELAPTLLTTLGQSAAVFLLNPLKDGLLRYTDLAPLYQRTAPTELFLWFSHKQMEMHLLPSLRTNEGATALTNLLRGDRWKRLLAKERDNPTPSTLIDGLIRLCVESMQPHFLSVQRLAFPVRRGLAHVAQTPYTLLFATRRSDSLASLNDACCQRTRRIVAESQQGVLNEHWFAQQRSGQMAAAWEALVTEALTLGRTQRIRRWPDLRQQLLLGHFGQHTLQEYDHMIMTLLARGTVRCEWQKRSQETSETRLPGPGDVLLWS